MYTKNLMVFFLTIASVLILVTTISAATTNLATIDKVEINGIEDTGNEDIAVEAGDIISIRVTFIANESASDVKLKVEIEGTKVDVSDRTAPFDVEDGERYSKTLKLRVPYELKDEVSDDLALNIKIWNGDYKTEHPEITLRVQRPSYNADIMFIDASQNVEAGELYPVDVVLKNIGYNYLDDLYVTAKISALGIERTSYFGDLVALECTNDDGEYSCDESDEDSVRGRFYLKIPYDAEAGIYTLEVQVTNEDLTVSEVKQIVINNDFANNVIVSSNRETVSANEDAKFELLLVNPTNKLKVYRVVVGSSSGLSTNVENPVVAVPAGSSRTATITASAKSEGEYDFDVSVFSGEKLVSTSTMTANVEGRSLASPIVILTIILAIIFIVLLVVLIVLLGKKPEKQEEFGESYY